jgi:hypothetical protein
VIDIFDVVFGDLQRSATHRGQQRRVGVLPDYDHAVAQLHARMSTVPTPALRRITASCTSTPGLAW